MGYSIINLIDLDDFEQLNKVVNHLVQYHISKTKIKPYAFKADFDKVILYTNGNGKEEYNLHESGFIFNRLGKIIHFDPDALP